ncbi:MAG: hypothetical protein KatS3mg105_2943 [Gemmatales bacterium]|nr:MAG: hypothetical protein KatS3mg105_2943 [Gemmatales bacterium]
MSTQVQSEGKARPQGNMIDAVISGVGVEQANIAIEGYPDLPAPAREFLNRLLRLQLLTPFEVRQFLEKSPDLSKFDNEQRLGRMLVQSKLLTTYQLDRVEAGKTHGLVLGNYRVLERLGAGSMAVVFLAEHFLMKRRAAVKVLPVDEDCEPALLERFYGEIDVLANLHHPHIVMAYDAGELPPAGPGKPALIYLVMELVDGGDLEQYLVEHCRVSIEQACDWIRQAACGLQEAHDHHLIHRDIKPSNLLLTRQGDVKVVDFGLARQFCSSLTNPGVLLGSVEFMAPEQSRDPTTVSAAADIYGLGASLFWLLTGELPYPPKKTLAAALKALQTEPPRRVRSLRPEVPPELDNLIDQMLQRNPSDRPSSPLAVMRALTPFVSRSSASLIADLSAEDIPLTPRVRRTLLVMSDEQLFQSCAEILESLGCRCERTTTMSQTLEAIKTYPYELVLIDLDALRGEDPLAICQQLRKPPISASLRILALSKDASIDATARALSSGIDDLIGIPFERKQLSARVQQALRIKDALDRYEQLNRHLRLANRQLESSLEARADDVRQAQDAILFAMAKMAESRDGETAAHLRRLQLFSVCLAQHVADDPEWAGTINADFLEQLERCVPLHDIGKIGLPDHILCKPGRLDPHERTLVETHTIIGSNILESLAEAHGDSLPFLGMARVIVRHHHERYDGRGYPDRLAGENIPRASRIVAVADVYDALRRKRFHKPPLPHAEAARFILEAQGQFDPVLVRAFAVCQGEFERIFQEIED